MGDASICGVSLKSKTESSRKRGVLFPSFFLADVIALRPNPFISRMTLRTPLSLFFGGDETVIHMIGQGLD